MSKLNIKQIYTIKDFLKKKFKLFFDYIFAVKKSKNERNVCQELLNTKLKTKFDIRY